MPEIKQLPYGQVVRLIAERDKLAFALLLGAGASKSSGVPLASEMIEEWRRIAHREQAPEADVKTWCGAQEWFGKDNEYSRLFEMLYLDPPSRQKYIETKMEECRCHGNDDCSRCWRLYAIEQELDRMRKGNEQQAPEP